MQEAHRARKSRKVDQGPIEHVNREEIGLYRDLTGISGDSTGISENRTKSQKSSRRPSGTHQQGFKRPF